MTCRERRHHKTAAELSERDGLSCAWRGMTATQVICADITGENVPPVENMQCSGLCGELDVGEATRELKFAVGVRDLLGSGDGHHGCPSAPCELRTVSEAKLMANS